MVNKITNISKARCKNLALLKKYSFDERYVCDDSGVVYLLKETDGLMYRGIAMSPFVTKDGYVEYVLTDSEGNKKHIQAQRIVAILFLRKSKGKDYVNHKNGNKKDNRYLNLEWVTQSDNIKHTYDTLGRKPTK